MTDTEFSAWAKFTMGSAGHWHIDPIHASAEDFLAFCPLPSEPSSGIYVNIRGGVLETGRYQDAIPHIGEAFFMPKVTKTFASAADAHKHAIEALGIAFLLAITHGTSPYRSVS